MAELAVQRGRKRTYFIAAVWLTWTVIGTLSYARHYFEDSHFVWPNGGWPDFLSLLVGCFYPWALLTPGVFWLEARFSLTKLEWKQRLAVLVLASFAFSYISLQIGTLLNVGISYAFGQPISLSGFLWRLPRVEFYFEQFFFWSTLAAGCAIRTFTQFHQQARKATQFALEKSQLEASLRQAELETLRMRLNPHFLFNTLQNISVLAQMDPKLASRMLTRLGDVLRAALRRDVSSEATVRDEMATTQDYLAVEKMRFGDRLTILMGMAPGTEEASIPSFLLQPLVENAVIHGLRGVSHAGLIAMRTVKEGDQLVLTIADNGIGVPEGWRPEVSAGIGLSSTRERLDRMYPAAYEFRIRRLDEGGTEVRVAIPFRLKDRQEENLQSEQPATVDR
jgi:two-component system LytT family sensor kinase